MVALDAGAFGRDAFAPLLPGQHALADVYSAVVDDVGLDHAVAAGLHQPRQREAEQIVADVAEVERLVGVGRRIFDHHQRRVGGGRGDAVARVRGLGKHAGPVALGQRQVQEAFDDLERGYLGQSLHDGGAYLGPGDVGRLLRQFQQREDDHRVVAVLVLAGHVDLNRFGSDAGRVESCHGLGHRLLYLLLDVHYVIFV